MVGLSIKVLDMHTHTHHSVKVVLKTMVALAVDTQFVLTFA